MPKKGYSMTDSHKKALSEAHKARYKRLSRPEYDLDEFDNLTSMQQVLERIKERADEGWHVQQVVVKNGTAVFYRKGG